MEKKTLEQEATTRVIEHLKTRGLNRLSITRIEQTSAFSRMVTREIKNMVY